MIALLIDGWRQVWKRQKEFEQALRQQAESKAEDFEKKFNEERAQRLRNLHQFNREEVRSPDIE